MIEEAPREWSALCADAVAVIEGRRPLPSALTGEGGPWLVWEADRLDRVARQVAEIAQRLAGDTETAPGHRFDQDNRAMVDAWRTAHDRWGNDSERPELERLLQDVADAIDAVSRYDFAEDR